MNEEEVKKLKSVEFYSQGVAAWFNTALEHDKSLLTLSVAALGFLVGLMPNGIHSIESLLLYISAIISFLVCLFSILMIYKKNLKHIQDVFMGKDDSDKTLEILDTAAGISFFLGVLLSSIIGISAAITNFMKG
jgi:hypothetical protein